MTAKQNNTEGTRLERMARTKSFPVTVTILFVVTFLLIETGSIIFLDIQERRSRMRMETEITNIENVQGSLAACTQVEYGGGRKESGLIGIGSVIPPPNPDGATIADVGFYVEEIPAISETNSAFTVEGVLTIIWCDPRLAFGDAGSGSPGHMIYLEEVAQSKLEEIWWPDLTFSNEISPRAIDNDELIIFEDGTVFYKEKFSVDLEGRFDLGNFPHDRQSLEIEIESFAWDEEYLTLHADEAMTGFSSRFELPEWHTVNFETKIEDVHEIGDRSPFSEFLMIVEVERKIGFYLWKILLPFFMLVMISWSVFWMSPHNLSERLGVSFTGILTVVAYQFVTISKLPAIPYLTLMDKIIFLSFVLMLLTIAENLLVSQVKNQDTAALLDRTSRWAFPITYVLGVLAVYIYHFYYLPAL